MLKKVFSVISLIAIFTSLIVSTSPSKNVSAIYEEPFEIISMRSQYEKHFCNPDGTKTAFVYTTPIHYNVNGEWIDIDNTLIKNENGDYTNAKNSMSITLSSSSYAKGLNTIDDTPLASLTYGKHNISWDIIASNNDTLIFHFYLRHGNGTCTQHGGTCSIWSHKRGDQSISNAINFTPLCDNNIASLAYNSSYSDTTYDTRLRFYTIQQDTNVYNSWYVYNSNTDKTAYIY